MAIRERLRQQVAPLLQPGEEVQAVFLAQTERANKMFGFLGLLGLGIGWLVSFVKSTHRAVVATNQRILVLAAPRFRRASASNVVRELRRDTIVGPPEGPNFCTHALGEPLWIAKRFHPDVKAANAASGRRPA